ncbi:MAG: hypothetical protein IPG38_09745 [Chitinophagaceae bacterium]|nr:hypothetical protein [Chitinophagaceae bacterium]
MGTEITCPSCGHQFELNESLKNEVEKELRGKVMDWQKKKEEDFEKQKTLLLSDALKKAGEETAAKLRSLEEEAKNKTQQLQELQKKELDLLREKNALEENRKTWKLKLKKDSWKKEKRSKTQPLKENRKYLT